MSTRRCPAMAPEVEAEAVILSPPSRMMTMKRRSASRWTCSQSQQHSFYRQGSSTRHAFILVQKKCGRLGVCTKSPMNKKLNKPVKKMKHLHILHGRAPALTFSWHDFAILEPRSPSIDDFYAVQKRRSADFVALKFGNCLFGRVVHISLLFSRTVPSSACVWPWSSASAWSPTWTSSSRARTPWSSSSRSTDSSSSVWSEGRNIGDHPGYSLSFRRSDKQITNCHDQTHKGCATSIDWSINVRVLWLCNYDMLGQEI